MAKDKKWIQKAVKKKNKGLLHKELHVPLDKNIPQDKLDKVSKGDTKVAQRARFAKTMKRLRNKKK